MVYDCIIVLPNKMDENGSLNRETYARVKLATEYYHRYGPLPLILSGSHYAQLSNHVIAQQMKEAALELGVDPEDIIVEENSRDTVGDAYFTLINAAQPANFESILVISSDYHLARAKFVFEFIYGKNYQISVAGCEGFSFEGIDQLEAKSLKSFQETFTGIQAGDTEGILKRMVKDHPYYNGKIYPTFK